MSMYPLDRPTFERELRNLRADLRFRGLDWIERSELHKLETIVVVQNKMLSIRDHHEVLKDSNREGPSIAHFALKVGSCHGHIVWATAMGAVVLEPLGEGKLPAKVLHHPQDVSIRLVAGNTWPIVNIRGLKTPMDSRTQALVMFDIVRWVEHRTPASLAGLEFPNINDLYCALRSYRKQHFNPRAAPAAAPPTLLHRRSSLPFRTPAEPQADVSSRPVQLYGAHPRAVSHAPPAGHARGFVDPRAGDFPKSVRAYPSTNPPPTTYSSAPATTRFSSHAPREDSKAIGVDNKQINQNVPAVQEDGPKPGADMVRDGIMDDVSGGDVAAKFSITSADVVPKRCILKSHGDSGVFDEHPKNNSKDKRTSKEKTNNGGSGSKQPVADEAELSETEDDMSDVSNDSTRSIPSRVTGVEYASSLRLGLAVNARAHNLNISADFNSLPILSYLRFEQHRIRDYLPVRLYIRACYVDVIVKPLAREPIKTTKKVRILCDLWAQIKPIHGSIKAPHMEYVAGRPADKDDNRRESMKLSMKAAQKGMPYHQLRTKLDNGDAKLVGVFRWFEEHKQQLQALIKYSYILATESPDIPLADHLIPQSDQFVTDLTKICECLGSSQLDPWSHETDLPAQFEQDDHHRKTGAAAAAAKYVEMNGVEDLDGLPVEVQQGIDADLRGHDTIRKRRSQSVFPHAEEGEDSESRARAGSRSLAERAVAELVLGDDVSPTTAEKNGSDQRLSRFLPPKTMRRARPIVDNSSDHEDNEEIGSYRGLGRYASDSRKSPTMGRSISVLSPIYSPTSDSGSARGITSVKGRGQPVDTDGMDLDGDGELQQSISTPRSQTFAPSESPERETPDQDDAQHEDIDRQNTPTPAEMGLSDLSRKRKIRERSASPVRPANEITKRRKVTRITSPQRHVSNKDIGKKIDVLERKKRKASGRVQKRDHKNKRDNSKVRRYDKKFISYARMLLEEEGAASPACED
ncbi:hypothetical protein CC86DRAFT_432217 [Ophiobolus disseminans]|uniref:Uncharacterized protein n=1 Tax=Ophiobolus disseminans TaxID=1469910 RepID=A0A6A6ZEP0_9PLEO|nr:hypothetical protein CC86DRAFT_432217 [Ophiobolus disseminans]